MMSDATDQPEDEGLHESLGTVGESMTVAVVTLRPDMRTPDAVGMLRNHGVGGAPVVEAGRLIGIATVSDLVALAPRSRRQDGRSHHPILAPPGKPDDRRFNRRTHQEGNRLG